MRSVPELVIEEVSSRLDDSANDDSDGNPSLSTVNGVYTPSIDDDLDAGDDVDGMGDGVEEEEEEDGRRSVALEATSSSVDTGRRSSGREESSFLRINDTVPSDLQVPYVARCSSGMRDFSLTRSLVAVADPIRDIVFFHQSFPDSLRIEHQGYANTVAGNSQCEIVEIPPSAILSIGDKFRQLHRMNRGHGSSGSVVASTAVTPSKLVLSRDSLNGSFADVLLKSITGWICVRAGYETVQAAAVNCVADVAGHLLVSVSRRIKLLMETFQVRDVTLLAHQIVEGEIEAFDLRNLLMDDTGGWERRLDQSLKFIETFRSSVKHRTVPNGAIDLTEPDDDNPMELDLGLLDEPAMVTKDSMLNSRDRPRGGQSDIHPSDRNHQDVDNYGDTEFDLVEDDADVDMIGGASAGIIMEDEIEIEDVDGPDGIGEDPSGADS
jgi:hypothetical protein